jgi:hypothetical protein
MDYQVSIRVSKQINEDFSRYAASLGLSKGALARFIAHRAMECLETDFFDQEPIDGGDAKVTVRFERLEDKDRFCTKSNYFNHLPSIFLGMLVSEELQNRNLEKAASLWALTRSESHANLLKS